MTKVTVISETCYLEQDVTNALIKLLS